MYGLNPNGTIAFNSGVAFSFLATVAVAFRLYSKTLVKAGFAADDWWVFAALCTFWIGNAVLFWGLFNSGGGADLDKLIFVPAQFRTYLKSLYVAFVFYLLAVALVKISILCLYRRIFATRRFRQISLAVGVVVIVHYLVAPGHCRNFNAFALGIGIADMLLDAIILTLPVRMVIQLKLSRRNQITLIGIFLLGGFVIITGILRLIFVYQAGSENVSLAKSELWCNIHLGTGIICACLPTYRPLRAKITVASSSLYERYGALFGNQQTAAQNSKVDSISMGPVGRYEHMAEPANDQDHLNHA